MTDGAQLTYALVGILTGGVCDVAVGRNMLVPVIVRIRNIAIKIASVLFLEICIFFLSPVFIRTHFHRLVYF